jgi:2-polyprenyl-3-methyl-5-hydroxy-6-metoxy-1,4-benzoquinol methylase
MADLDAPGLDFKTIYSDRYFSGDEYVDYLRDQIVFEKQFRDRLRKIEKFRSSGDLIEVGCAYGFFLAVAKEHFRVRGYDISEGPVNHARSQLGVDAHCEDIVNVPLAAESVDVVVMWDTVEHLPRPDLTVDKIGYILRPGGYLFLTTGDIGSL